MTATSNRIIPGNSDIISISGNQIKVSRTSVFEITLCGRISDVTNDTGGNLEVRIEIIGNDTGNISFSMVNIILKSYKL